MDESKTTLVTRPRRGPVKPSTATPSAPHENEQEKHEETEKERTQKGDSSENIPDGEAHEPNDKKDQHEKSGTAADASKDSHEKTEKENLENHGEKKHENSHNIKFLKLFELQKVFEEPGGFKKHASATISGSSIPSSLASPLADLRPILGKKMPPEHAFCFEDGSIAEESMSIQEYLEGSDQHHEHLTAPFRGRGSGQDPEEPAPTAPTAANMTVFIISHERKKPEAVLLTPPFVMKVFEWTKSGEGDSGTAVGRGSVHSKSLGNQDFSNMTLSGLRKRIPNMSSLKKIHRFCTQNGTSIDDESLTISDYLNQESQSDSKSNSEGTPTINIYYKLNHTFNEPARPIDIPDSIKANTDLDNYQRTNKTADAFSNKQRDFQQDLAASSTGSGAAKGAAYLSEQDWHHVLTNCAVFYGWYIDKGSNRIIRAPKQAFQLKQKPTLTTIPDFAPKPPAPPDPPAPVKPTIPSPPPQPQINLDDEIEATAKNLKGDVHPDEPPKLESIRHSSFQLPLGEKEEGSSNPKGKGQGPTEKIETATSDKFEKSKPQEAPESKASSAVVAAGIKVSRNNRVETTPTVSKASPPSSSSVPSTDTKNEPSKNLASSEPQGDKGPARKSDTLQSSSKASSAPSGSAIKTGFVMPSFQVSDDSRIEVTVTEHEFEASMAKNDFSSSSTEGSASGGFGGYSVSASVGVSKSQSSSSKTTSNTYKKTMMSKYLYPRAIIFLDADELEPTPELALAIENIRQNKNISDLRQLHKDFGHLFCTKITLGGRLMSSKILESTENSSEQEQKEQFKTSMGMQIQTPFGGASVKHDEEHGSDTSSTQTEKNKNEKHVFEAVGGDTILAPDAAAWSASVANEKYWRVIDRDGLSSFADFIGKMGPGLAEVPGWFIRAVPNISKYIEFPDSHQVICRFKLLSPLDNLSMGSNAIYYLGHDFGKTLTKPCLHSVSVSEITSHADEHTYDGASYLGDFVGRYARDTWTKQINYETEWPLFTPAVTRAPVLMGYANNVVGGAQLGSTYDKDFLSSAWNIIAPFDDALKPGTRIILQTVPFEATDVTPESAPPDPAVSMVVYRNQQGVFLPALSDSDDFQYWRIWKTDGKSTGEYIKEGDSIRLTWNFADQTTGFRDFSDDIFGRRRNQCPPELQSETLYLKLPWPRFESIPCNNENERFNSMIMDEGVLGTNQKDIKCLPADHFDQGGHFQYDLDDITFRIDTVANDGRGDTDDYMLKGVVQEAGNNDLGISTSKLNSRVISDRLNFTKKGRYANAANKTAAILTYEQTLHQFM
ncbi:hypothetical protein TWF694_005056 [Orbilia ellipsospora]|uniref:MACPF-like domain-containing protein n=1 Tax=Orbilia ellipsospora TaxID=2528407 RepID=A0AAV9WVT9_9PEZI